MHRTGRRVVMEREAGGGSQTTKGFLNTITDFVFILRKMDEVT